MPKPPADYQWTLSLPAGQNCSVGFSTNMVISADGNQSPGGRANEDKFFTCSAHGNQIQAYIVLDGHDGLRACEFVRKHLPSVFLDNLIRDERSLLQSMKKAFEETEKAFFVNNIDPHIIRKMTLQFEIDQRGLNSAEAYKLYPGQVAEIQRLDEEIRGGTTVVMAVVFQNRLYVANCGDSRAVLCSEDSSGKLTVRQISVDHNTQNDKELERLAEIGLDPDTLRRSKRLGTQQNTRSIGDYTIKGGYKEIDIIAHAKQEPGTAEPYIASPIDVTGIRGFLLLMSDGLYEAYEAWTHRPTKVNEDIAHLVAKEIRETSEFHLVAQKVVEKVKTVFLQSCKTEKHTGRLDDITLIIRNFGFPSMISHSHSVPKVSQYSTTQQTEPYTAPVIQGTSQASNVFFGQQMSSQNPQFSSNITSQTDPYQEFGAAGLPPSAIGGRPRASDFSHAQQQQYPTNAQHTSNGAMSMAGGEGFFPEPGSPEFGQQISNTSSTRGQGGFNDGNRYHSQGPLSISQMSTHDPRGSSHYPHAPPPQHHQQQHSGSSQHRHNAWPSQSYTGSSQYHTGSSQQPVGSSQYHTGSSWQPVGSSQHRHDTWSSQSHTGSSQYRTGSSQQPAGSSQHQSLEPSASLPIMNPPPAHIQIRKQSEPTVSAHQTGSNPSHIWTVSSSVASSDQRRPLDYESANPLGTEQTQSEQSSSRSSVYENVHIQSQNKFQIERSEEQLGENFHNLSMNDTPQKSNERLRTPDSNRIPQSNSTHTPLTTTYTPSTYSGTPLTTSTPTATTTPPADRRTPVSVDKTGTPGTEYQDSSPLTRRDSAAEEMELYGWVADESPPGALTGKDRGEYDTLKEAEGQTHSPSSRSFGDTLGGRGQSNSQFVSPPTSQSPDLVDGGEDEEETIDVEVETEPQSDHEAEDVDGSDIKSCVKFSPNFPDISWDDIKV